MSDHGEFTVQITPLFNIDNDPLDPATFLVPTQFSDVNVSHPLNDGRTASVVLSIYNPVVAGLQPYQQALRILYTRPGETTPECVFWGQTNVEENYDGATVTLTAQDPSIRMQHHYVRIGDIVMNDPNDNKKGSITPDYVGISELLLAANPPSGPALGCDFHWVDAVQYSAKRMGIERGQEVWDLMQQIITNDIGPDMDMHPSASPSAGVYCTMDLYESMLTDLSSSIAFEYGYASDNMSAISVSPGHPTTHAVVIDNKQNWRALAVAPDEIPHTGAFVDWIATDHEVKNKNTSVLEEKAKAHIRAYGRPPRSVDITLRPDSGQDFYYGHPDDGSGDFYVGDIITLHAQRGYRSMSGKYRITQVELSASGARGQIQTKLTVVPRPSPVNVVVVVADT